MLPQARRQQQQQRRQQQQQQQHLRTSPVFSYALTRKPSRMAKVTTCIQQQTMQRQH